VNQAGDDIAERFRVLLSRRHFLDRESGVLLVWLPADRGELAELIGQVEARHPATRFSLQEAGAALAIRMSARDQELAEIEALYVDEIPRAPVPRPSPSRR
jgi:hypothetical protein